MIHCLNGLQAMKNPTYPLHESIISWEGYLIKSYLTSTINFDTTWLILGEATLLTDIADFYITLSTIYPMQALVPPSTCTYTHKRISIPVTAYMDLQLVLPLLRGGGPRRPTKV